MEVPRHWRLSPSRIGFKTEAISDKNGNPEVLRYPGGEISLSGGLEEVEKRLSQKGFNEEAIGKILFSVFGGVSPESPVAAGEVIEGVLKFLRSEVGEKSGSEVELGINRLPR